MNVSSSKWIIEGDKLDERVQIERDKIIKTNECWEYLGQISVLYLLASTK